MNAVMLALTGYCTLCGLVCMVSTIMTLKMYTEWTKQEMQKRRGDKEQENG